MSETPTLGLPDAAHHLGTSVRVLRRAIRTGRIPAPPHLTATTTLSAEWLDSAKAAIEAAPQGLRGVFRAKVAPFARYPGTSGLAEVSQPRA